MHGEEGLFVESFVSENASFSELIDDELDESDLSKDSGIGHSETMQNAPEPSYDPFPRSL